MTPASIPRRHAGGWLLGVAALVVVATLVAYFTTIGSPQLLRQQRQDQQRLRDLQELSSQLQKYHSVHGQLPASQSELVQDDVRDPVSGQHYQYLPSANNPAGFQLCARFAAVVRKGDYSTGINGQQRPAQPGRHCFVFETGKSGSNPATVE